MRRTLRRAQMCRRLEWLQAEVTSQLDRNGFVWAVILNTEKRENH